MVQEKEKRLNMKTVTRQQILEAVAVLKKGGVVVFPTETAYGLAADAKNAAAVRRVFRLKGREAKKSPPLIVADAKMAEKLAVLSPVLKRLVKAHWPGALTVVAPATPSNFPLPRGRKRVSPPARACPSPCPRGSLEGVGGSKGGGRLVKEVVRNGEIALRVSSHPVARALCQGLGGPIVATSANVSGKPACYSVAAFRSQFSGRRPQPDLVLDAGALPRRAPSTIVREEKGEIVVLRRGGVTPPVHRDVSIR